ncbi:MAG: TonB-dependent receptor [Cryomorphaceae bacterium]
MRIIALFVFLLYATLDLQAQVRPDGAQQADRSGLIAGRVVGGSQEAIPFANVALYATDSALIGGSTTNDNGMFQIPAPPGAYFIEITFLSFEPKIIPDVVKEEGQFLSLRTIELTENAALLNEVVIEADRSTVEFKLDKRVFNVGADLSNAGGNAADILQNVPSVDVDIEGNVSLRGSENVRILIDGKQSGLVGSGNADALRLIQGNMIEKIEVITNPSSKYEAEGEVGILNIVLKKEKQKGFNGSFEVKTGYPANYGGSFNINYRRKWINMFASAGLNYRRSPGRGGSSQVYNGPDTAYTFESTREHERGGISSVNRAGADFFINDKNTLTAAILYKYSDGDNVASIEYRDINNEGIITTTTLREEEEREVSEDIEFSLTHVKTFSGDDHKWTTDIRANQNYDREKSELVQTVSSAVDAPSFQRSSNTEDQRTYMVQSDYTQPLWKKGKFETGVRGSFRRIENFYSVDLRNSDTAAWVALNDFTDNLIYTENIYAAYALFGNEWRRFSYQLGIRSEYTDIATVLELSGLSNPRAYLNFFPSGHLNYALNETNSLQTSYSRRLSRPSFRELIPFFSYTDPRFFYGGNPDLNPEYTDSYELGYLKMFSKGSFLGSVYYRHTTDAVQRITLTDTTGLLRTFPVNLGTQDAYGVEANLNLDIAKWWRINGSANAYYAVIQGAYRGTSYDTELLTMMGRVNSTFSLPQGIDLQVSGRYRAPRNTPQGKRLSVTTMDVGLARDFFKGKGTLVFNVNDVFNSGIRRSIVDTEYLYSESSFQWRVRQFQLTFNYRINQRKQRGGNREGGEEGIGDDF